MLNILAAVVLLTAPGDDLVERLKVQLKALERGPREQVLRILERLPEDKRVEAAEEFLKGGCDRFLSRFDDEKCSKLRKKAIRYVGNCLNRMPDDDKRELAKCFLDFYKSLPDDVRKEMLKTIQSEIFKGMAPKKDK